MPDIQFRYGNKQVSFDVPARHLLAELDPARSRGFFDLPAAVARALDSAQACGRIRCAPTLVVIPDKTRYCGAELILPALVSHLNKTGVADRDIRFMLANGSHAASQPHEIDAITGKKLAGRFTILQHDSRDKSGLVEIGETSRGIPVWVNRYVVAAEQLILVATAVHHYFAGYGGGPKMIVPGCAGYETIRRNHALTVDRESGGIHPQCRPGMVAGNPIQDDIREALRFFHIDLLLETVAGADGQIIELFAGELYPAHARACQRVDQEFRVEITHQADLVVAGCGGFPKDINVIQAHKTLFNAFQAVRPGGTLVILAECSQGVGSETFLEWFDYPSIDDMVGALVSGYKLNGTTALSLAVKAASVRTILVSGLAESLVRKLGMLPAANLSDGWQQATQALPGAFDCYCITNGSITLPVVK